MNPDSDKNKKDISTYRENSPVLYAYFKDKEKLLFIYKKTERIISALHLVAKLFPEKEPLRSVICENALSLLPAMFELESHDERKVVADLAKILSLLQIASDGGFLSSMNYSIIRGEIENLGSAVTEYIHKAQEEVFFPRNFFKVESHFINVEKSDQKASIKDTSYKGQSNVLYKSPLSGGQNTKKDTQESSTENRARRRQKILEIINAKGNCTIKDFSYVITDYSEKTIQRELGAMVLDGVLIKTGKKRWSTYSLRAI